MPAPATSSSSRVILDCCPQCGASLPAQGERVVCAYCGSSLIRKHARPEDPQSAASGSAEPAGPWGIHLRRVSFVDELGTGIEAFQLLIPAGWQFEGGVQWTMKNPNMPAEIAFRVFNPQGAEALEAFPNIACVWTNPPVVSGAFAPGSLQWGNEVRPPMPALQALQELVIPRYRGHRVGLQVVQQEHLPQLAREMQARSPVAPTAVTSTDGARMRIRYRAGGREIEEDFFGVVEESRIRSPAMPFLMGAVETTYWMADYLFSFTAQAGALDGLSDTFMAIVRSFRLNPQWYARYVQAGQSLAQGPSQLGPHIGQFASQTGVQMNGAVTGSYHHHQAALDRLATQFRGGGRGVDSYRDSLGDRKVALPGGYGYAWSNPLGEYILTDDPNFDPNVGGDEDWGQLRREESDGGTG